MMERVTFRLEKDTLADVQDLVDAGEYDTPSEAFREGLSRLDGVGETERPRAATDGGDPDPRVPPTVRDGAHAQVHDTERCDGAGDSECVRVDSELTRGEDEIHVTNYGPGSSRNGRRVLCGECHDKQTALNIADDPELGMMYRDKLEMLAAKYPDILADVDVPENDGDEDGEPMTDGGACSYCESVHGHDRECPKSRGRVMTDGGDAERVPIPTINAAEIYHVDGGDRGLEVKLGHGESVAMGPVDARTFAADLLRGAYLAGSPDHEPVDDPTRAVEWLNHHAMDLSESGDMALRAAHEMAFSDRPILPASRYHEDLMDTLNTVGMALQTLTESRDVLETVSENNGESGLVLTGTGLATPLASGALAMGERLTDGDPITTSELRRELGIPENNAPEVKPRRQYAAAMGEPGKPPGMAQSLMRLNHRYTRKQRTDPAPGIKLTDDSGEDERGDGGE